MSEDSSDGLPLIGKRVPLLQRYSKELRIVLVLIFCGVTAVAVPYLTYRYVFKLHSVDKKTDVGTCRVSSGFKIDCLPDYSLNSLRTKSALDMCDRRGCCWDNSTAPDSIACYHSLPSYKYSAQIVAMEEDTMTGNLSSSTFFSVTQYRYKVSSNGAGHVLLCIGDEEEELSPSETPQEVDPIVIDVGCPGHMGLGEDTSGYCSDNKMFTVEFWPRGRGNSSLIRSHFGPIMVSETLSEISFYLPTGRIFGPGMEQFIWSGVRETSHFDFGPDNKIHLPFLLGMHYTGQWFMLWLNTGYPGEQIISPGTSDRPILTWRTMGGSLKVHLLLSDTLDNLLSKARDETYEWFDLIQPDYWTLGYHICRNTGLPGDPRQFAYDSFGLLNSDIPFDSDCIDEQLLLSAFSLNNQYNNLANQLTTLGDNDKRFVLSLVAQVLDGDSPGSCVFIFPDMNDCFVGRFNGFDVTFPDPSDPDVSTWIQESYDNLLVQHITDTVDVTGWSLHDSRPTNTLTGGCPKLPFKPRGMNISDSLCSDLWIHYQPILSQHSRYSRSWSRALSTLSQPSYQMSDVFYLGQPSAGGFQGSPSPATWSGLSKSLREIIILGLAGQSVVSMPACGTHTGEIEEGAPELDLELLCLRWFQLAAFMPSIRSWYSGTDNSRLPHNLEAKTYQEYITWSLRKRYQLLPYLWTLQVNWATTGVPLVRPMFHQFQYSNFMGVWKQVMIGPDLLVAPVLSQEDDLVSVHIPRGTWYDFHDERKYQSPSNSHILDLKTHHLYEIPVFQRGGSAIVMYSNHQLTSADAVTDTVNLQLSIGLNCQASPRALNNCTATTSTPYLVTRDRLGPSLEVVTKTSGGKGSIHLNLGGVGVTSKMVDVVSVAGIENLVENLMVNLPGGRIVGECGKEEVACYSLDMERELLVIKRADIHLSDCGGDTGGCEVTWNPGQFM